MDVHNLIGKCKWKEHNLIMEEERIISPKLENAGEESADFYIGFSQ